MIMTHKAIANGYRFEFRVNEDIRFSTATGATVTELFDTPASYISNNTWYTIKITRTTDGEFTASS